jgi:cobalt transporter subunit CbtB
MCFTQSLDQSGAAPATVSERRVNPLCQQFGMGRRFLQVRVQALPLASPETGPQYIDNKPAVGGRCSDLCMPVLRGFHALDSPADTPEGSAMSIISSTHHAGTASTTSTLSQRLIAAIGASILGACLVYFAGFSHIDAVHNAAHDTRHSSAFPCH